MTGSARAAAEIAVARQKIARTATDDGRIRRLVRSSGRPLPVPRPRQAEAPLRGTAWGGADRAGRRTAGVAAQAHLHDRPLVGVDRADRGRAVALERDRGVRRECAQRALRRERRQRDRRPAWPHARRRSVRRRPAVAGPAAGAALRSGSGLARLHRQRPRPSALAAARARPRGDAAHVLHHRDRADRRDARQSSRGRHAPDTQGQARSRRRDRDPRSDPLDLHRDDPHRCERGLGARAGGRDPARDGALRDRVLRAADPGGNAGAAALDSRALADPAGLRRGLQGRRRPPGAARLRRGGQRQAGQVRRNPRCAGDDRDRARAGPEGHAGQHGRERDHRDRGGAVEPAGRLGRPRRPVPDRPRSVRRPHLRRWKDRAAARARARRTRTRGESALSRRYAILALHALTSRSAKMAHGVIRYGSDAVVAVSDPDYAGRSVRDVLPYLESDAPIVATLAEALRTDPTALLVGIAPAGGALPDAFRAAIVDALRARLEIVSGLHAMLREDPELAALAREHDTRIWDLRLPPAAPLFSGAAWDVTARIVLTVGSDAAVGKMTAALELCGAARAAGVDATFVPSGQIGIAIAGWGTAIDAVVADFAPVTLALLYGGAPDALVLVHNVDRTSIEGYDVPLLSYRALIRTYEGLCAGVKPAPVVGIALNTRDCDAERARAEIARAQAETGLPCDDVVRNGPHALYAAIAPAIVKTAPLRA